MIQGTPPTHPLTTLDLQAPRKNGLGDGPAAGEEAGKGSPSPPTQRPTPTPQAVWEKSL